MKIKDIKEKVIPKMKECNVISVTLTGGEPFTHPDIIQIVSLMAHAGIKVSICTNGTLIQNPQLKELSSIGQIHINVSLDGFRPESHGMFRGNVSSFEKTYETIKLLGKYQLLNGLLVTPNNLASIEEYEQICRFAIENRASYVLMNPLSNMGRGKFSKIALEASKENMELIRTATSPYQDRIQIIYVRFPNELSLPLGNCEAGNIIYIFADGETTVCPYLLFAARNPQSQHTPEEFIAGNILTNQEIALRLEEYKLFSKFPLIGQSKDCKACPQSDKCGKGCPAAIIASGNRIDSLDYELCPKGRIQ